jgi:peptidoglycan/LPS O-acetylase OafA/YrhL
MVKAFYLRRALRIWPLYFFLVLLLAGPTYLMGFPAQERYVPFWSYLLFVQNIPMSAGYWALFAFAPLWSIAVEEQFYIAAPLLVRKASMRKIKGIIVVTICCAIAMRIVCLSVSWVNDAFTLCRLDAIAIGFLGAVLMRHKVLPLQGWQEVRRLRWLVVLMLPGFLAIAVYSKLPLYLGALAPCYVAFFFLAVLLLAIQNNSGVMKRVLRNPLLMASGKFCYFLYLFHLTVLYNVEAIWENAVLARVVSLCVCFGLAFISWRFLESPLIAIGRRWAYSVSPDRAKGFGALGTTEPILAVDAASR